MLLGSTEPDKAQATSNNNSKREFTMPLNKPTTAALAICLSSLVLSGCFGSSSSSSSNKNNPPTIKLVSLSSAPDQVSGDNILLGLEANESTVSAHLDKLELWLNDTAITPTLRQGRNGLEILVSGLSLDANRIDLHHEDHGPLSTLEVTVHPITGPMFSGPQQYPFVCSVVEELGVQPLVDEGADFGYPVRDSSDNVIGLSKDCSIESFVKFIYRTTANGWADLPEDRSRPADMATTTLSDGREVDFIVRHELGTINRFIYSFATLAAIDDAEEDAATDLWNGRLLYHFEGGVAIGHSQGRISGRATEHRALEQGYAVIYSTGNRTSTHYNLQVGGETALMVKEHFIKRFGVPNYTVAIGGSGGGIQQYVYAQNHPGLLDGGVPQYAYPDMVTQTIHIGDCELLEHYMDVTDQENSKWTVTSNRSWLVGLHATDDYPDPLATFKTLAGFSTAPGMTECIPAWRGLTPLVMNPLFGQARNQQHMEPPGIMNSVIWTHYDDLKNIYGEDERGARTLFDNVGVQYGLEALREGNITQDEFLHLNAFVGGWKHPSEMVQEGQPFLPPETLENLDPWSRRNMNLSADGSTPAPRTEGDLIAINAAYASGMVFDGELTIPMIDWRHYLEEVLDMHNSHQSFSARQRIRNAMGHSDNQLIWFTDGRPTDTSDPTRPRPSNDYDQTWMALEVLHDWIMNIRENPDAGIAANKPPEAVDACFNSDGTVLAAGTDVWHGILDDEPAGDCTQAFQTYTTSRMVAGGPIEGSIFKCALKPVAEALSDGTYGSITFSPTQIERLNEIFPTGVCDYSAPDQGRPAG